MVSNALKGNGNVKVSAGFCGGDWAGRYGEVGLVGRVGAGLVSGGEWRVESGGKAGVHVGGGGFGKNVSKYSTKTNRNYGKLLDQRDLEDLGTWRLVLVGIYV